MRIVVDATAAERQMAGVGRFARGVLRGLAAMDRENDYILVTTGRSRLRLADDAVPRNHRWIRVPIPERAARIAWHRLHILPSPATVVPGAKLFFTPDFALPPAGRVPSILTVHDLSFVVHPECADDGLRRYLSAEVPRSIRAAAAIVAVSHTTALALQEHFGVDPARIAVVPNGVEAQFSPLADSEVANGVIPPFGLPSGFLLSVGTLEPRKNYVRLLQAVALLNRRLMKHSRTAPGSARNPGPGVTLVIAGREGWMYEPIFREVARLSMGSSVRFFANATDADLLSLYRHAGAFVFPSLYEGFGIPPLEAMACGVPVASSSGGSLPEVLGDAAQFFDPLDVEGMSRSIEDVLLNADLRRILRARGPERAAEFTWDRAGEAALSLFERVASRA